MELILAIAAELNVPNERVKITKVQDGLVWFTVNSRDWTAKITKTERLKKNSIRVDLN